MISSSGDPALLLTPQGQPLEPYYLSQMADAVTLEELEKVRLALLGKQGEMTTLMKSLGKMSPDERKEKGDLFNRVRGTLTDALEVRRKALEDAALEATLAAEREDLTLPIQSGASGRIHPLSQALFEALEILRDMGFAVAEGPDIEDDFHNFSALNIHPEHPARQDQDTFYLKPDADGTRLLLRTHTSPVQIRAMLQQKPPLRIVAPGRVYRSDYDQTHTPVFHQIEGLFIDKDIHMGHLKGCLEEFCRRFFGVSDLPVRFRPGYFPFTEPSAEIDIGCRREKGRLVIGGGDDWLEILGAGMVHPNVLTSVGVDPDTYQGFAFGMGIERIAMLKYGITDLRAFYEGDLRWLNHYGVGAFSGLLGGDV
ncbi:MAG: phenylalanine--tRNA ligase subunit alpha [Alphaproteobacteria bacterium]|nr:phenylalanine--tRNA ligase subunit alpha [Alphaproteobacteria bacterium]